MRVCAMLCRMKYTEKLANRIAATGSALCVGLDPRPDEVESVDMMRKWLEKVIGETAPYAAAFILS